MTGISTPENPGPHVFACESPGAIGDIVCGNLLRRWTCSGGVRRDDQRREGAIREWVPGAGRRTTIC